MRLKATISAGGIDVRDMLNQIQEDLNNLPVDIESFARKIFMSKEIQEFIIERNLALLEQGKRPDLTDIEKTPEGGQTSNFYERRTIYERSKEGLQTKFVDLHKTGFFYESLKVRAGSNELLEFSSDPKAPELERIWGEILGISSEDLDELILKLRNAINKFTNGRFRI